MAAKAAAQRRGAASCDIAVKYWEIIADRLSASGWSWGMTTAYDTQAGKLFIVDAHRCDGRRFIVRSDELLTAFLVLEREVCRSRR